MNLRVPFNAAIEVTENCNYKCPHCYRLDHSGKSNTENDLIDMEQAVQILIDNKVMSYTLTGGEPFAKKELCLSLIKRIKKRNYHCTVNTNLSLLDNAILHGLMENKIDGMLVACPSTDPHMYSELTGGGDVAIFLEKLNVLLVNRVPFFINIVFSKQPLEDILKTIDTLHGLGVKNIGATPMALCDLSSNRSLFNEWVDIKPYLHGIIEKTKKLKVQYDLFEALPFCAFDESWIKDNLTFITRTCQAGKTSCAIGPDGEVRACPRCSESYGNILKISLKEIWGKMSIWRSDKFVPQKCKECTVLQRCRGACRANAKSCSGQFTTPDPWAQEPITRHIDFQPKSEIILTNKMVLAANGVFYERKESNEAFLISTSKSKGFFLVNREFYFFIKSLIPKLPISIEALAEIYKTSLDDINFNRIMRHLIGSKILNTTEQ
jgi:radical SAM protein with 4Fe4S-binding SPASM domain